VPAAGEWIYPVNGWYSNPTGWKTVLEGSVALPRAVRDPGLARHHRALQADLHRCGLGVDPPVPHDGGVHGDLLLRRRLRLWRLVKLPTEGDAPYAVLVFAGMLPWQFFSTALSSCSESLISNANLLTKVYFPRLIVPAAAVITSLVDFLISFVILAGLMLWYQWWPSWRLITLPLWVAVAFAASMGAGLWLASLNVQYRDFRYVVPFLVQCGLCVSPVGFSSALVPAQWQLLYALNPMVGVIEGFRWTIIGQGVSSTPRALGCRWGSWPCCWSPASASSGAWKSALQM
jgi:ABC-type polysaccharide/polyol phosphate export permease